MRKQCPERDHAGDSATVFGSVIVLPKIVNGWYVNDLAKKSDAQYDGKQCGSAYPGACYHAQASKDSRCNQKWRLGSTGHDGAEQISQNENYL